jgi:dipeptidyl aminopeptidase/acylaminoacyl peptidase
MEEQHVNFVSDGLKLDGVLHWPDKRDRPLPTFLVFHGFGGNKEGLGGLASARMLQKLGYATLRFDFRGCGKSEGPRGRTICLEQVEDAKNALGFLAKQPGVDGKRIGVIGHSFGAAVAVYTAGVDPRVAACISAGGWGHGEKKFRKQHPTPEAWKKFSDMMEEGKRRRARGEQLMVPRFDIVPIPPAMRSSLSPGGIMEFPFDVVDSMYNFNANDVVGKIAPRPLLLVHSSKDSVTPTEQSIDLFVHAGQPTDLYLVAGIDHFGFEESNIQLTSLVRNWLEKHFPLQ